MTTIHRLLDEVFAGFESTPEVQDLKEEIRANLAARAAELEASGLSPDDAAQRAVDELGDVRELVTSVPSTPSGSFSPPIGVRVRPKPAFVVRTVLLSLVAFAGLVLLVLDGLDVLVLPIGALAGAVAAIALSIGIVIADALRQETTTNYPLSNRRAIGFGVAGGLTLAGLGIGWLVVLGLELPWLIAAAIAVVAAIVIFAYLGATKTNRHKPWVLRHSEQYQEMDRFTQDPASAARFGIYTAVIWIVAFVAFVVLSFTIGWAWSWLALVTGFVVMMITLARMLFPPKP